MMNPDGVSKSRTYPSRKKACQSCTVAKARCDHIRPTCSRCLDKQLSCEYPAPAPAGARVRRNIESSWKASPKRDVARALDSCGTSTRPDQAMSEAAIFGDERSTLLAPLDATRIRDRWLDYFFTPTTKQLKAYPARVMSLMRITLCMYPIAWLRHQSHLPPFVHRTQCSNGMPESLANCLSLLRLCTSAAPGSESMVRDSFQREMMRLAEVVQVSSPVQTLSHQLSCLSALQAHLILSMYAYFSLKTSPGLGIFTPNQISALHDLASTVSATGIICPEEIGDSPTRSSAVPQWESWIIAESKRRTVFCVYMFEDLHNFENNAATYLADELATLLAPTSKWLWQANDRTSFERQYSDYITAWDGENSLRISEFWPREIDQDGDDADFEARRQKTEERISRWTETVDEFGMFLLAVCTVTHNA